MSGALKSVTLKLGEVFNPEMLGTQLAQLLTNIVVAVIVFVSFYVLWRLLQMVVLPVLRRSRLDETAVSFVATLLKYGMLVVGFVNALNALGIQTSAVLASLGIAGLTVGFAARDALSNIISGILIFPEVSLFF
jgi:small conductance mechanosensitive channel